MKTLTKDRVKLKNEIEAEISDRAAFLLSELKRIRDEVFGTDYPKYVAEFPTNYQSANFVRFDSLFNGRIYYVSFYAKKTLYDLNLPDKYLYDDSYESIWRESFLWDKESLSKQGSL